VSSFYLNERIRVAVGHLNFKLQKLTDIKNRKTGELEAKWVTVGYYGKVDALLKDALLSLFSLDSEEYRTATEISEALRRMESEISEIGKKCVSYFSKERWYDKFVKEHKT
jgi:Na+/phosphate symporter